MYSKKKKTHLGIPELAGHTQILAAPHQGVGLGRLARLPEVEVRLAIEGVFSSSLCHKLTMAMQRILTSDQLGTIVVILNQWDKRLWLLINHSLNSISIINP